MAPAIASGTPIPSNENSSIGCGDKSELLSIGADGTDSSRTELFLSTSEELVVLITSLAAVI